jgi:hypothetical protein
MRLNVVRPSLARDGSNDLIFRRRGRESNQGATDARPKVSGVSGRACHRLRAPAAVLPAIRNWRSALKCRAPDQNPASHAPADVAFLVRKPDRASTCNSSRHAGLHSIQRRRLDGDSQSYSFPLRIILIRVLLSMAVRCVRFCHRWPSYTLFLCG